MFLQKTKKYIKNKLIFPKRSLISKRINWRMPAIVLLGEPEYDNLGDHAIAYATKIYINKEFPNYEFISVTEDEIRYNFKNVKKLLREGDVVLLQGGGNMGDLYPDQVALRRKVLKKIKKNHIIIMPQTVYFAKGNAVFPPYYEQNNNHLTIVARESVSYDIVKTLFNGEVITTPDIVFYLSNLLKDYKFERRNAIICLRDDKEKNKNFVPVNQIISCLKDLSIQYDFFSMVLDTPIKVKDRQRYMNYLFKKFSRSKLVITDRLHAMIIASITKTPCVVLPTFNHKVVESYRWIQHLDYVEICDCLLTLRPTIIKVLTECKSNLDLNENYSPLTKVIYRQLKQNNNMFFTISSKGENDVN